MAKSAQMPVAGVVGSARVLRATGLRNPMIQLAPAARGQDSITRGSAIPPGHGQELVQAGERLDFVFAAVALDAAAELVQGQEVHDLGEKRLSGIHRLVL
jgi:hypothetical protein